MNRKVLVAVGLTLLTTGFTPNLHAGPFHNFFKKVRHAFTHPESSSRHHRTAQNKADGTQPNHSTVNSDTERMVVTSPPKRDNTRTAQTLSPRNGNAHSADLPYGTPVPGKKGFVTSPYAPNSGYIDARNFPPGTQVKDPYTGKTFLTP